MSAARETFNASVKTAGQTALATVITAETTKQETINASGVNVGYTTAFGNYGNLAAAVKAANAAKLASIFNAEVVRQASVAAARETLRSTGDVGAT
jgi:hypothetical protein